MLDKLLNKGSILYLASDGFIDQNDETRHKFGSKKFHELLQNIQNLPLIEQKETLLKSLSEHQQNEEQRDDITVIGLKL